MAGNGITHSAKTRRVSLDQHSQPPKGGSGRVEYPVDDDSSDKIGVALSLESVDAVRIANL